MRKIGIPEIEDIATGAALLGAGGGGDPYVGKLVAIGAVQECGPVTLLDPEEAVSYTHLRAHETVLDLVCRLLLEKNFF